MPRIHFNQDGPGKKMILFGERRRNKAKNLTKRKKGKNAIKPTFTSLTEEMIMQMNHPRVKMKLNMRNLPKHMNLKEMSGFYCIFCSIFPPYHEVTLSLNPGL